MSMTIIVLQAIVVDSGHSLIYDNIFQRWNNFDFYF